MFDLTDSDGSPLPLPFFVSNGLTFGALAISCRTPAGDTLAGHVTFVHCSGLR